MRTVSRLIPLVFALLLVVGCGRTELGDRFVEPPGPTADAGATDSGTTDAGMTDAGDSGTTESCSDEIQNGTESDVDCGGDDCRRCDEGELCNDTSDCTASTFCNDGVCEAGRDIGESCSANEQCLSDECLTNWPETDFCTQTCADRGCPANFACLEDRCVPIDYCDDIDSDGEPEGPGCMMMGCDDCDDNASCVTPENGADFCECNPGYAGNGQTCSDVDECADPNSCGIDAICVNEPGSFRCSCPPGFEGDPDVVCNDIDECALGTDNCSPAADCTNERGGFQCDCRAGYTGDGVSCMDVDECANGMAGCDSNATCINRNGGFECRCNMGYTGDGFMCTLVDACGAQNPCSPFAACATMNGQAVCTCNSGYTGDGFTCTDVDECATGADNCDANATCTNTVGSWSCACNAGYMGDGVTCTPVANCAMDPSVCDPNATCQTDPAGVSACVCDTGYMGDGFVCADIDECATGADDCDPNAVCTNTPGSFMCACPMGFTGDGLTCTDIDECSDGTANCDTLATCANTPGSFTCTCPMGYSGDGTTCSDIDECATNTDDCGPNSICTNTPGSFTCACAPGTTLVNGQCVFPGETCSNAFVIASVPFFGAGDTTGAVDNYSLPAGTCGAFGGRGSGAPDDVWEFTPTTTGTYEINVTDSGWSAAAYILTDCSNTSTCVDQDVFDPNLSVQLNAGTTYYIVIDSAGNPGFRPQGPYTLNVDLNECASGTDNCSADATCSNNPVGFTCSCNAGFTGDGVTCTDIDECATNSDNCSPDATCTNTPGGFDCTCNMGFIGDGVVCIDPNAPGETCMAPNVVSSLPYTYTGDTSLRTDDYSVGFNQCTGINGGGQGSPDEVFSFTPTVDGSYTFDVTGSFTRVIYLTTNCADIANSCLQGDLGFGSGSATISTMLNAGTTYFLIVDGLSSFSEGQFTINITKI